MLLSKLDIPHSVVVQVVINKSSSVADTLFFYAQSIKNDHYPIASFTPTET